jgi:hypothetical protein
MNMKTTITILLGGLFSIAGLKAQTVREGINHSTRTGENSQAEL